MSDKSPKETKKPATPENQEQDDADILVRAENFQKPIEKPKQDYPFLKIIHGPEQGTDFPLATGHYLIGRSRTKARIILDDTSVSRQHAEITIDQEGIILTDLGSRNGTFVNHLRLNPKTGHQLKNKDLIKLGIYEIQIITKEDDKEPKESLKNKKKQSPKKDVLPNQNQEKKPDPEAKVEKDNTDQTRATTDLDSKDNKKENQENKKAENSELVPDPSNQADTQEQTKQNSQKNLTKTTDPKPHSNRGIFWALMILVFTLATGITYFYFKSDLNQAQKEPQPNEDPSSGESIDIDPKTDTDPKNTKKETFFTFLEVNAKPLRARIFLNDKYIGSTPLKVQQELINGQTYEIAAEYQLTDIGDIHQVRQEFTANNNQELIPIEFDAKIGSLKITRIPRGVSFYMEGYYQYDKVKLSPVKLQKIVYGKPIYLPYGDYTIELREKVKLKQSNTFVDEIRYQRKFTLDSTKAKYQINISQKELKQFPAKIDSRPQNATIFVDDKKVGTTPFEGNLPLGKLEIKLVKDGYFDFILPLEMRTNTAYEATYELKTSAVGHRINKARQFLRYEHYDKALSELIQAIKIGGTAQEKANVHLLLGQTYFAKKQYRQATAYFERARKFEKTELLAILGLAKIDQKMKRRKNALKKIAQVLLHENIDKKSRFQAQELFKKISPYASVLYIGSKPKGAEVYLNNKKMKSLTPMIIPDLSMAYYRIEVRKNGYYPQKLDKTLKVGEFIPMFIELKPIPQ